MKHYPKTYEDLFTTDKPNSRTKLNFDKVSFGDMGQEEYIKLFNGLLYDFYGFLFDYCVKIAWMRRQFTYYGEKTVFPLYESSRMLHTAFVKILRRHVGMDLQLLTRSKFFSKLELYFNDFFPGFEKGNPFTNPEYYKFPFKHVTIDFLMMVYQLDDRMDLLKEAESKKMTYAIFMDYVINHVYSINEELGKNRYQIKQNDDRNFPFFIQDTKKILQAKKGKKRSCKN